MNRRDRCQLIRVPVDGLEAGLAHPDLADSLASGWSVAATLVIDDGSGPALMLILSPPPIDAKWKPFALAAVPLLGALVGAVVGSLLIGGS